MAATTILHVVPSREQPDGVGDYQKRLVAELQRHSGGDFTHVATTVGHWPPSTSRGLAHVQLPMRAWRKQPLVALLSAWLRLVRRVPVVVTMHEWHNTHPLRRAINLPALAFANAIIFPTADVEASALASLRRLPGLPVPRSVVIPIGPNLTVPARPQATAGDGPVRIGYFGFLYPGKMPMQMLAVFERIAAARPDVQFDIVGDFLDEFVAERAAFAERLATPPLAGRVKWHGHVANQDEAIRELGECRAFVLFNQRGFTERNGSVLTVLQFGAPVFSSLLPVGETLSPQVAELVTAGTLNFVDHDATEATAAAVLKALDAPRPAVAYSPEAAWRDICAAHEAFYHEVLNRVRA